MRQHRATPSFGALIGAAGICAAMGCLILIPAYWLRWEADTAQEEAQLAVTSELLAAQRGLREFVGRVERATSRLRAQDLVGDAVTLNERLLRGEPLIAPAVGLTVVNGRGVPIASSASPVQANSLLPRLRDQAYPPAGQVALLGCSTGAVGLLEWLVVRSIGGASDKPAGLMVSTLPDVALRSLMFDEQAGAPRSTITLQTDSGCELLRRDTASIAWQPDSALLRFIVQHLWPEQRDDIAFKATGRVANLVISAAESTATSVALRGPVLDQRVGTVVAGAAGLAGLFLLISVTAVLRGMRSKRARNCQPQEIEFAKNSALAECETARRERDEVVVERDRIFAAMGHDVRSPLNSILGSCALLMEGDLTETQRKWHKRIRTSCEALLAITNGMLETATARIGGTTVHLEEIDIASLVEEMGDVLRQQAEDKGLELNLDLDETVVGFWRTDQTRLRQVLYNLCDNAIKYTMKGSVKLSISTLVDANNVSSLCLQVTDTGPGITPDERERIFERFQRGREEVSRGQEGVGLGLTLCRDVALLLNGTLSLDSTPGVGSTFTFVVPVERAIGAVSLGGPLAGRSALVVGFTENMRHRVSGQLERLGMVVETIGDGYLAAGYAERMSNKHSRLDLLVLDAALRGLSADAVLIRLLAIHIVARDLRCVVVANGTLPPSIAGRADAVIPHPVDARQLEKVVGGLFGDGSILREVYPRAPSAPPPRVLVVEDGAINKALVMERLTRTGFSPFAASNGREAVEAMHRGGFDLVLMDVQMPEMDGLEATRQIRAAGGAGARVPIVGMTAHTGSDIRTKCVEAGMTLVLHKPIEFVALPLQLRQAIGGVRVQEESGSDGSPEGDNAHFVSREHLDELVATIGPARSAAYLSAFLGEVDPNVAEIQAALVNNRWEELGQLAHQMAGVSSELGALNFSECLLAVENAARDKDAAQAGGVVGEAYRSWERARASISSYLAKLQSKRDQAPPSGASGKGRSGTALQG